MSTKKVYFLSLGSVLLASLYPLYMGVAVLWSYAKNGGVDAADYPKYVIPYTPVCFALILCIALLPLVYRLSKKLALPVLSVLGTALFLTAELSFEKIVVFDDLSEKLRIESWQVYSCMATPPVMEAIGNPLIAQYSQAFKMHFYIIALVIILTVTGVAYGFYKMAKTKNYERKKPIIAQLISVTVFVGLCILVCFTAFFRTGEVVISPVSAVLMTAFFVVFGVTAGVYAGTWLYKKRGLLSVIIPSIAAMFITVVMYIGELILMGGALYRFGSGFPFDALGSIVLAPVDVATVLLSGIITFLLLTAINKSPKERAYEGR